MNDQQMMEMMIRGIRNREQFMDETGEYKDLPFWQGVAMDGDNVIEIHWDLVAHGMRTNLGGGIIDLCFMPPNVKRVTITQQNLYGCIDTRSLPRNLIYLNLIGNRLRGKIVCSELPPNIEDFIVMKNHITELVWDSLPQSTASFWLNDNLIAGALEPSSFPKKIVSVDLSNNFFNQDILVIGDIPDTMIRLDIQGNNINTIIDIDGCEVQHACIEK